MNLQSEWRVSSNFFDDKKHFIVYRIRDLSEPDHSGNREYRGNYITDREEAKKMAADLNAMEDRQ